MENDLVRFILARLDDDDREIKKLLKAGANGSSFPPVDRLSADSAAKREIIGVMQRLIALRDLPSERPVREGAAEVLRRMALPYEKHAGYRPEWRPKRSGV